MNNKKIYSLLAFLFALNLSFAAHADYVSWDGSSSDSWTNSANWSTGVVPSGDDNITISSSGTNNYDVRYLSTNDLVIFGSTGKLKLYYDASLTFSNSVSDLIFGKYGDTGNTELYMTSGAQLETNNMYMGYNSASYTIATLYSGSQVIVNSNLYFGYSGNADTTISYGSTMTATNNAYLAFYDSSVASVTIDDSTSALTFDSYGYVGYYGQANIDITAGGDLFANSNLYLGRFNSGYGSINVNGSGSLLDATGNQIYVGYDGNGAVSLEDGADMYAGTMYVGSQGFGDGSFSISGSGSTATLSGNIVVGSDANGSGVANIYSGASVYVNGALSINEQGTVNLYGGYLAANTIYSDIAGSLNFYGGELEVNSSFKIAGDSPVGSYLDLNSSQTLDINGTFTVMPGATLRVDEGEVEANTYENAGYSALRSGGKVTAAAMNNRSTFTLDGGSIYASEFLNDFGATISGEGLLQASSTLTNNGQIAADGFMEIKCDIENNGTLSVGDFGDVMYLYFNADNYGLVELAGGAVNSVDGRNITNSTSGMIRGNGTLNTYVDNYGFVRAQDGNLRLANFSNQVGGELRIDDNASAMVNSFWNNNGLISMKGDNARLSGMDLTNTGTIQGAGRIDSSLLNDNGTIIADGGTLTLAGTLANYGRMQVNDGATLAVSQGLSSNFGDIILRGGTFNNQYYDAPSMYFVNFIDSTIVGNGTIQAGLLDNVGYIGVGGGDLDIISEVVHNGDINIQNGCTLTFYDDVSGSGSFTGLGNTVFLANYSPGSSPAAISFAGDVVFTGTSELVMELGGTIRGDQYDFIDFQGSVDFGGDLQVNLINEFVPSYGDIFDLFDFDGYTGSFDNIILPELGGGLYFSYDNIYEDGTITVVPEPVSIGLIGLGMLAVVRRSRK